MKQDDLMELSLQLLDGFMKHVNIGASALNADDLDVWNRWCIVVEEEAAKRNGLETQFLSLNKGK